MGTVQGEEMGEREGRRLYCPCVASHWGLKENPRTDSVRLSTQSGSRKKDWRSQHQHLFPSTPKAFGIGGDVVPKKRDLSRYVKWPRYVRLQRQRGEKALLARSMRPRISRG